MVKNNKHPLCVELPVLRTCEGAAGAFFSWLKQAGPSASTTVDEATTGTFQEYYEILGVFKTLNDLEIGQFIVGRKGRESRIEWNYTTESICNLAFEITNNDEDLIPIQKYLAQLKSDKELSAEKSLEHELLLRPNYKVKITLPDDFNAADSERIIGWLKMLPF